MYLNALQIAHGRPIEARTALDPHAPIGEKGTPMPQPQQRRRQGRFQPPAASARGLVWGDRWAEHFLFATPWQHAVLVSVLDEEDELDARMRVEGEARDPRGGQAELARSGKRQGGKRNGKKAGGGKGRGGLPDYRAC